MSSETNQTVKRRGRPPKNLNKPVIHKLIALPAPASITEDEKQELAAYAQRNLSAVFEQLEVRESCNGARQMLKNHPALYTLVYQALLSGQPPYIVCQQYPQTDYTIVCQIRRIYPEIVLAGRRQIVHNLEQVSLSLSTRLALEGNTIGIDKVAGTLATVIEKLQLLTGGVTSRSEHVNAPKPEELQEMFNQLPTAKATVLEDMSSSSAM